MLALSVGVLAIPLDEDPSQDPFSESRTDTAHVMCGRWRNREVESTLRRRVGTAHGSGLALLPGERQ